MQQLEWEPFGHEFAGIVTKIGAEVQNVAVGDRVAIETSTFNPFSDAALNGRPEYLYRLYGLYETSKKEIPWDLQRERLYLQIWL